MCPGELEPPHAKAKGSECRNERKPGRQALAAGREQVCRRVRRPAGRSRGRATPATRTALADAPFPTEPDLPVCERHDPTGEPGALNRHAGFGERGAETWQCERMRHPHDAKAAGKRLLPHAKAGASLPDSTIAACSDAPARPPPRSPYNTGRVRNAPSDTFQHDFEARGCGLARIDDSCRRDATLRDGQPRRRCLRAPPSQRRRP